jgi:hypothetical protein
MQNDDIQFREAMNKLVELAVKNDYNTERMIEAFEEELSQKYSSQYHKDLLENGHIGVTGLDDFPGGQGEDGIS